MDDASSSSSCPTCGTSLSPGAFRCPGCGRVLGEANRCPSCNAIAGVLKRGPWHVCAACGARRDLPPGTVVLQDLRGGARLSSAPPEPTPPAPRAQEPQSAAPAPATGTALAAAGTGGGLALTRREGLVGRGSAIAWRTFGGLSIAAAILGGAVLALVIPGISGIIAAGLASLLGLGTGALAFGAARKGDRAAARARRASLEQAVIAAAAASDGNITATEAAVALGIPLAEADALLSSMADGSRIAAEIDPDGIVRFELRELRARRPAPHVRVEAAAGPEPVSEDAEAELVTKSEKERTREQR